jgi:hypothetical protein
MTKNMFTLVSLIPDVRQIILNLYIVTLKVTMGVY